ATLILHDLSARDEVRTPKAYFAAEGKPEELFRRVFHEIVLLDVQHSRKRHPSRASRRILRVVDQVDLFDLAFRVIGQHNPERPQNRHDTRRATVEIFANAVLELRHIDDVFLLRHANARTEIANGFRRETATTQPGDSGHTRVVPSRHAQLLHQ